MRYKHLNGEEIELLSNFRNLAGEDLSNVDLQSADFSHENFADTNFSGSNLRGADFSNSYLKNCNFTDALLEGTKFVNSTCFNAKFTNAILNMAEVRYGRFNSCWFSETNLQDTVFSFVDLEKSVFNGAIAIRTSFLNCFMRDTIFFGIELSEPSFMWNVELNFEAFATGAISSNVIQFMRKRGARLELKGDIEYWTHHFGGRL